jgi:hypothetical protein
MLFVTPSLGPREEAVLAQIDELEGRLRLYLHEPRRWIVSVGRAQVARAVAGSGRIGGFVVLQQNRYQVVHLDALVVSIREFAIV